MKNYLIFFFLSVCLWLPSGQVVADYCEKLVTSKSVKKEKLFAQCVDISNDDLFDIDAPLNIAVRHAPPFVFEVEDVITKKKKLEGIAVDLWEGVAGRLGVEYQYVCAGLSDTLSLLESGSIDMAISPLTITKEREKIFDFSHQYFNSGLVFAAAPGESSFDFEKAFNTLSNSLASKNTIYLLLFFMLLLGLLVFFALKKIDHYEEMPIMKEKKKSEMVTHVVLYSLLNISGVRQDVFGFSSIGMQLLSFGIMIFGITISASLFSMVTAALTQSVSTQIMYSVENMQQYKVTTLQGSTAQNYICDSENKPDDLELTNTWKTALQDVVDGNNDVVFGDWVQLVYLAQEPKFKEKITVYNQSYQFEPYGWGLKTNHPRKDEINQELMGLLRENVGANIVKKYIGNQQISMQSQ